MLVVDSSAIVDLVTRAPNAPMIAELLVSQQLHAPELIDFEVMSAIHGKVLGAELSPEQADEILWSFANIEIDRWPLGDALWLRAIELRHNLNAYDAVYVVLAELLQCRLVTHDGRLARASGHRAEIALV